MKDLCKFSGVVLFALLFAAQIGTFYPPRGGDFTQAALSD